MLGKVCKQVTIQGEEGRRRGREEGEEEEEREGRRRLEIAGVSPLHTPRK
jgi:hypothetical protein